MLQDDIIILLIDTGMCILKENAFYAERLTSMLNNHRAKIT